MPRDMIENERQTGVNPSEATEEKVSLSDRFGLWLGFHACSQDDFLGMIRGYCDAYGIAISDADLRAEAIEWSPDPRRPLGPRRLAVRHRPRRPPRREARVSPRPCCTSRRGVCPRACPDGGYP